MNRAEWTRPAQADLACLDDHYAPVSPDYADRLGRTALAASRFLADHPAAGSPLRMGTRKWRVRGLDLVLIYRQVEDGIEVLRLRHGRENWRETE